MQEPAQKTPPLTNAMNTNTREHEVEDVAIWLHEAARNSGRLVEVRTLIRRAMENVAEGYGLPDENALEETENLTGCATIAPAIARFAAQWDECERERKDNEYANIRNLVENLNTKDQDDLINEIKENRKREKRQRRLIADVEKSRKEFAAGHCKPMTVDEIMREVES